MRRRLNVTSRHLCMVIMFLTMMSAFGTNAHAQTKLTAQSVMKFLNLTVGARSAALGGGALFSTPDASLHFLNPAGLVHLKGASVFMDHNQWIADIRQVSIAYTQPLGARFVIGAGMITMDYGDIPGTEIAMVTGGMSGNREYISTGQVAVNQYAVSTSLAIRISSQFSVGGQVKYAFSSLGRSHIVLAGDTTLVDNQLGAIAFDLGTQFLTDYRGVLFYMSLRNFAREQAYPKITQTYNLPLEFTLGAGLDLLRLTSWMPANHSLMLSFAGTHPIDYIEKYSMGLEYALRQSFFLRGGYRLNSGLEDWSMGVGLRKRIGPRYIAFDYSFGNTQYFSGTHRFSLSWGG